LPRLPLDLEGEEVRATPVWGNATGASDVPPGCPDIAGEASSNGPAPTRLVPPVESDMKSRISGPSSIVRRPRPRGGAGWSAAFATSMALTLCLPSPEAAARDSSDEACMMCHANADLVREGGNRGSVHVRLEEVRRSAHRKLACVACHTGAGGDMPHPADLPAVQCAPCHGDATKTLANRPHGTAGGRGAANCESCHGTHAVQPAATMGRAACAKCHGEAVREYSGSLHAQALARGDNEASTCKDCHGATHEVRSHQDPESPVAHHNLATTCGTCHADQALVERRRITIPAAVQLYENSVHGRSKNPGAATCSDCHESHALLKATDPASSVYRTNIPRTCGKCHTRELEAYTTGIHGQALARGVTRTPVCTDCHGEHQIRGPKDPSSPVASGGSVTATCASCHDATGIRETFGLPAGRLSSYRDSFHGLAARGGSPVVADCASCHGYHDVLPSTDPRSTVAAGNLEATCGRCHPGAGERFAQGRIHVPMAREEEPALWWIRTVYLWLIGLTIGGMSLHQGAHFAKQMRLRFRAQFQHAADHGPTGRWHERMTVAERWQHALLAVSFFTLVYTGFALKFPEYWLFAWFARLETGYSLRSWIHRGAAIVMVAVSLFHVAYLFTRRGRRLLVDLFPTIGDAMNAVDNGRYLAGLREHPPKMPRFSYIEKAEYWALVWGTVVMTATGFLLWFQNQTLRLFDLWVFDAATLIHYYEAWLAFLAIVVWHLYQNIANPEVYPMNWTWLHGKISEEQLRHEHGAQWGQIQAEARAREEAEARARLAADEAAATAGGKPEGGA
jgi:cytochrome b subunit of formate dehydrogenase